MYVEPEVIEAAATLIMTTLDNGMPVGDEAEWRGFDPEQAGALEALLDAVTFADLVELLRHAAIRMPEPEEAAADA